MILAAHPALETIANGLVFALPCVWLVVFGLAVQRILRNRRWPNLARKVARAAGPLPAAWLATFFCLVLLVRLKLGEWPYGRYIDRSHPLSDPFWGHVYCPMGPGEFVVLAWLVFLLYLPAVLSPLAFVPAWWESGRLLGRDWRPCAAFLLSYAILWGFWMNDPGGLLGWYWSY